ncbi:response regulator transcription factor [Brachybacterium sp. UMB0905]|uniref:response regulator transcription factor n=1 Tax=Brachybacterium sp. UMB0905 TaxID=2069310 RepID=UPI000C7FCEE0|nr:response regulator transcription factor [Brachybacterium sp. UMB0905]PMC74315.1 DNA-binding response regulator [Brachybacterium sp. UMB0905]
MAQILLIEDSPEVHALVEETLRAEGHQVRGARDGLAARQLLREVEREGIDLVVLDLMLPHVDGSVLLAELRHISDVPVLVLSAKDAVYTKVDILRLGADDYVTKPFDLTELTARVEVLLRRRAAPVPRVLEHGALRLDPAAGRAFIDGVEVTLTATELAILHLLMASPGQVLSRPRLYEAIWNQPFPGDDASMKSHLSHLRRKLREAAPAEDPIETVWGLGYRLRAVPAQ